MDQRYSQVDRIIIMFFIGCVIGGYEQFRSNGGDFPGLVRAKAKAFSRRYPHEYSRMRTLMIDSPIFRAVQNFLSV